MGLHNFLDKLEQAPIAVKSGGAAKMLRIPGLAGVSFVLARVAPTSSATGFASGCLWLDLAGTKLYINTGSYSSATWDDYVHTLDESYATLVTDLDRIVTAQTGANVATESAAILASAPVDGAATITFAQVASGLSATNVHGAVEELGTEKADLAGAAFTGGVTHAASVLFRNKSDTAFAKSFGTEAGTGVGGGAIRYVLDCTVTLSGAVASIDLPANIPNYSVIRLCQVKATTAITTTTATKWGLGVAADPDKYGLSADLNQNTDINNIPTPAPLASGEDVQLYACDNSGVAAGTLDTGTFHVRIEVDVVSPLSDAA